MCNIPILLGICTKTEVNKAGRLNFTHVNRFFPTGDGGKSTLPAENLFVSPTLLENFPPLDSPAPPNVYIAIFML